MPESTAIKPQSISVSPPSKTDNSLSVHPGRVNPQSPINRTSERDAYPIPPRRTKKLTKYRSKSSSTLYPLEEDKSSSVAEKATKRLGSPVGLRKRPLAIQHSNPESGRGRVKPPRPPPPVRNVPPRTFTQLDKTHLTEKEGKKIATPVPLVIDTRARRRRHSDSPQPKRPPLPYETFVPKPQSHNIESYATIESSSRQDNNDIIAVPADYEEIDAVKRTDRNCLASNATTSDIIPTGNRNTKIDLFSVRATGGGLSHDRTNDLHVKRLPLPYETAALQQQQCRKGESKEAVVPTSPKEVVVKVTPPADYEEDTRTTRMEKYSSGPNSNTVNIPKVNNSPLPTRISGEGTSPVDVEVENSFAGRTEGRVADTVCLNRSEQRDLFGEVAQVEVSAAKCSLVPKLTTTGPSKRDEVESDNAEGASKS